MAIKYKFANLSQICHTPYLERRVSIKEFAQRMKMTEVTFYDRIKKGEIDPPLKDGRYSYYLNSYVNKVVTKTINSDKVAANT